MPTAPPPRQLMHGRDLKTVRDWAVLRFLLALGVGLLPTLGRAEDPTPVPDHAYIDFGDHWKCDRGFKRVAERIGNTPRARARPWAFPDRELPHPPGRRGSPRASSRLEQSPATVHAVGTLRPAPLRVLFLTAGSDRDLSVDDLPAVRTKTHRHDRAPVIVVGTELSLRHSPHSSARIASRASLWSPFLAL